MPPPPPPPLAVTYISPHALRLTDIIVLDGDSAQPLLAPFKCAAHHRPLLPILPLISAAAAARHQAIPCPSA
jgi:hypothetical protein